MKVRVESSATVAAPGDRVAFVVQIGNDGDTILYPSLTVTGVAPRLLELPDQLTAIQPGDTSTVELWLNLPPDAMPGAQRVGVRVQDPDGWQRTAVASADVEIAARPDVALDVTPASSRGRRGAQVATVLHNRSAQTVPITLWGQGEGVQVAFSTQRLSLQPGEERTVATWIERRKRRWFRERRHGALIEARGRGAPVLASTSFVQRPLISAWMWKLVASVTAIAVWAAAVVVAFNWMSGDEVHPSKLAAPGPGVVQALAAAAAAAAGEGDDDQDALPVGDEGSPQVVISGSVAGPADPGGTDVVIERIAFGDAGTTASASSRLAAMTPPPNRLGSVLDRVETSTDERGNFRVSGGLSAPAFYRVTALRTGFEVASQVVQTDIETLEATAELALVPATGSLSGRVTSSAGGGLGGVTVTVSDGQLTYTTTTATDDNT